MDLKKKTVIFFDLDGTVVDTGLGIKNGVRYAASKFGVTFEESDSLDRFIGPPLSWSFSKYFGLGEKETAEAIATYREYYASTGLYECEVYPGIRELFRDLKSAGKTVCIATSKPERFASILLDRFSLSEYVDCLGGATFDGTREKKADIINYVLDKIGVRDRSVAVLVGDRHFDVDGAKACSMDSVGVLYGYGDREEFVEAGADAISETVEDLRRLLI